MTKAEQQILIDKLEEYAVACGYYEEAKKCASTQKEAIEILKELREVAQKRYWIKGIMRELAVDSNDGPFLAVGRQRYKQSHSSAECQG